MTIEDLAFVVKLERQADEAAAERDAYREALTVALEQLHRMEMARWRLKRRRREARERMAA